MIQTLLALTFAFAHAAVDPRLDTLVDQYIEISTKSATTDLEQAAQQAYANRVAVQIARLEPGTYNDFTLELLTRYASKPAERASLFTLVQAMKKSIEAELEQTAEIERGPYASLQNGATTYATLIVVGALATRGVVYYTARFFPTKLALLRANDLRTLPQSARGKIASGVAAGGGTMVIGAGMAYLEYWRETQRTHKVDPEAMLNVLQADLACGLSFGSLELADQLDKLVAKEPAQFVSEAPAFLATANDLVAQASLLADQFARVDNLSVEDRLLQKNVKAMPANYASLRKQFKEGTAGENVCKAISTTHVKNETTKMIQIVQSLQTTYAPPAPAGGK